MRKITWQTEQTDTGRWEVRKRVAWPGHPELTPLSVRVGTWETREEAERAARRDADGEFLSRTDNGQQTEIVPL